MKRGRKWIDYILKNIVVSFLPKKIIGIMNGGIIKGFLCGICRRLVDNYIATIKREEEVYLH
ncbi:MAG: hypothetical protein ACXW07_10745 [Nitrososphaeraceae archaeon]